MNFSTSDALLSYFFIKGILSSVCLLVNFGERAPFPVYWPPAWQDNFFFFFQNHFIIPISLQYRICWNYAEVEGSYWHQCSVVGV